MTTETGAPATAQAAAPAIQDDGVSALSMDDARALIDAMPDDDEQSPAQAANDAPAEPQSPSKEDGAAPETDPSDDAEANDPDGENQPPIERPRSWAKELDEEWKSYPRAAQERILAREQERDAAIRRSQNDLAEQRKALEAEHGKAKQLQTEYESRLPQLVKTLETALQNEFGDIQNMNDVRKLQMEDPFRFQQWQLRQMELAEANRQSQEVKSREDNERATQWTNHVQKENKAFIESLSDADKAKIEDRLRTAPEFLEQRGFTQQELADLASGKERLSIYDHRLQSLILDGMKYREIQNAPKVVAKPNLPPVQKPGHAGASTATDATIRSLETRFNQSGSFEDAWALQEARLKSSRRAS